MRVRLRKPGLPFAAAGLADQAARAVGRNGQINDIHDARAPYRLLILTSMAPIAIGLLQMRQILSKRGNYMQNRPDLALSSAIRQCLKNAQKMIPPGRCGLWRSVAECARLNAWGG